MHPPSVIRRVRVLLEAGNSRRAIASELGISRTFVNDVALGRKRTVVNEVALGETAGSEEQVEQPEFEPITPTRCGRCKAIVTFCPCPTCYFESVESHVQALSEQGRP